MKSYIDYLKENKILLAALAAVFIVCFFVIGTRYSIESRNNSYDIVLDYNEVADMAMQSEHDTSWWLEKFKGMGIDKVGLIEESFQSLMENKDVHLTGALMGNVAKDAFWQARYPNEVTDWLNGNGFSKYDVLVEIEGENTVSFVLDAVKQRFNPDDYHIFDIQSKAYILLYGTADVTLYTGRYKYMDSIGQGFVERIDAENSKIMYISLGLLPEKVEEIKSLGMEIVPRTMSYKGWNDTKFGKAVIESFSKLGITPRYMIVGGEAMLGMDDGQSLSFDYMNENGIPVGLIENTTQLQNIIQGGLLEVAAESGYNAVRVFTMWDYIQSRYEYYGYKGAEEIENTLFRAVTERNIRVIYFKPIKYFKDLHTYVTDVSVYEDMFANLEVRLAEHGIHYGPASVMDGHKVPRAFKMLFGIGAVLGAVLLLRSFLPMRRKTSLLLAGAGIVCVPAAFYVMPNTAELIVSLAVAIIFGCLATTFFTAGSKHCKDRLARDTGTLKIIMYSVSTLAVSVVIALLGGMLTAAPLSSVNYMLEIDIFRGVKVAQLLPIAYFAVAYLAYFGIGSGKTAAGKLEFKDLRGLLDSSFKLWMVLLGLALGGLGAYYIMRTGHDSSIEVSSYEMLFRNELENVLAARPRTKEFLVAFPSVMMMVYTSVRRFKLWPIVFGIGGVIGMTSVINTFQHIRTPLYLGFMRTGYSLLFGIIVGVAAILVFEGLHRVYDRFFRKYVEAAADV
ncbi:MAG: DUF5693 family protein [Clostridiales bacterium]|nr:DUF5693 family protein [Clostridiales bacterium]